MFFKSFTPSLAELWMTRRKLSFCLRHPTRLRLPGTCALIPRDAEASLSTFCPIIGLALLRGSHGFECTRTTEGGMRVSEASFSGVADIDSDGKGNPGGTKSAGGDGQEWVNRPVRLRMTPAPFILRP